MQHCYYHVAILCPKDLALSKTECILLNTYNLLYRLNGFTIWNLWLFLYIFVQAQFNAQLGQFVCLMALETIMPIISTQQCPDRGNCFSQKVKDKRVRDRSYSYIQYKCYLLYIHVDPCGLELHICRAGWFFWHCLRPCLTVFKLHIYHALHPLTTYYTV